MGDSRAAQRYPVEGETVDRCLDRVMETIRRELESGSPEECKKLIEKRKRIAKRRRGKN